MKIQEQHNGAVVVIRPEGSLVGVDAQVVRNRLMEASRETFGRFVLDASGIRLIDSKGLEALMDVSEELAHSGKVLKLCAVNELVREVLELTGLSGSFEGFEDANAAVRSFL